MGIKLSTWLVIWRLWLRTVSKFMTETITKTRIGRACGRSSHTVSVTKVAVVSRAL